jgi:ubiquinone/menaquinone biosynthesis C-methylase UbiE
MFKESQTSIDTQSIEMESQLEQIRDKQKETWNKFSPGWKKWDDLTMDFLQSEGNEIIRLLQPKENELVLDVASGTGEPGLTIATLVKNGKVIFADLAEGMLEIARENAAKRNITNIETTVCDVCDLPFEDNTFDSISCRLGFMFFPDMHLAAKEMYRVLKPGGKIATTVWAAPEKNFWATATMSVVNKNMKMPTLPVGSPGLFRCAERGMISGLLNSVGFTHVSESEVKEKLRTGTADVYWGFMTSVVAPLVAALAKADDAMKARIKSEVIESVTQKYPEGKIAIDGSALLIYGIK